MKMILPLSILLLSGCASVGKTLSSVPSVVCPLLTSAAVQQMEAETIAKTPFSDQVKNAITLVGSGTTAACHIVQSVQAAQPSQP